MLASLADAPLDDPQLVYEPKYDGIRAIAEVPAGSRAARGSGRAPRVRLWSRLGNEKTRQFPEVADALERWSRRLAAPVVLDGEIVALDAAGQPTGFQQLQGRIHVLDPQSAGATRSQRSSAPRVAFMAFDLLREGATDWRDRPLVDRRAALERLFSRTGSPVLRLSEMARGDGRALYRRALDSGWEGLIAKQASSPYQSGKRSPDWRKLKIVHEQEFVIGGWTEPRESRMYFGALLLGVYDSRPGRDAAGEGRRRAPALLYVGHTGTGFNERELARVMKLLRALETDVCPFQPRPRTNERPHWVEPRLVAQIKFTEWTAEGRLRHPVYLGLRDDKKPEDIGREDGARLHATSSARIADRGSPGPTPRRTVDEPDDRGRREVASLVEQLQALEESRRDGSIDLPGGGRLAVTNLHKVFWPRQRLTKGDLFRYYVQAAPFILPAVADRPLVMKRFPNGIRAKPFYQHRVDSVPEGVRVELVAGGERSGSDARSRRGDTSEDVRPQLVGGGLKTLLYMTQLAAVSQDPWFSRVQSVEHADHVALDLDPMPGVGFERVLDVARWIHDELQGLGVSGFPKTSGADGLHVYVPLPPGTPYEAGRLFCQIVATLVARKHPRHASVERAVAARGKRVYVDYLQNILGKTLATAYSARASEYAGVSTPLTWKEVHQGLRRDDFTIETMRDRLKRVGDLWAGLRSAGGADLSRVADYVERSGAAGTKGRRPRRSWRIPPPR
jgi:bifunctional non-homologous end joining protein LigD